jgi:hypothetical protein
MDVTAVQCTEYVFEVRPEFRILMDLGWDWIVGGGQKDISGVKWI